MPKTLAQIRKQIDALQRQAEEIKRNEVAGVVARIKEAIRHYDLTAADLGLAKGSARKAALKPTRKGKVGKIKFCSESGQTWTGHGRRPQWFVDALGSGKKPEDLLA